jgi:hypothetical protein
MAPRLCPLLSSAFGAVEVKNFAHVQPRDLKALRTFGENYPEEDRFLLYRGP